VLPSKSIPLRDTSFFHPLRIFSFFLFHFFSPPNAPIGGSPDAAALLYSAIVVFPDNWSPWEQDPLGRYRFLLFFRPRPRVSSPFLRSHDGASSTFRRGGVGAPPWIDRSIFDRHTRWPFGSQTTLLFPSSSGSRLRHLAGTGHYHPSAPANRSLHPEFPIQFPPPPFLPLLVLSFELLSMRRAL